MVVKLVYALKRKPGMSREDFHTYWRKIHGPLVAERKEVLEILQYHQLHTFNDGSGAQMPGNKDFDGVAELWWESYERFMEIAQSEAGAKALLELREDEKQFIG